MSYMRFKSAITRLKSLYRWRFKAGAAAPGGPREIISPPTPVRNNIAIENRFVVNVSDILQMRFIRCLGFLASFWSRMRYAMRLTVQSFCHCRGPVLLLRGCMKPKFRSWPG